MKNQSKQSIFLTWPISNIHDVRGKIVIYGLLGPSEKFTTLSPKAEKQPGRVDAESVERVGFSPSNPKGNPLSGEDAPNP
jgi:hypothetical protein